MERDVQVVEPRHALVQRLLEIEPKLRRRFLQIMEVWQIPLVGPPEIERVGKPGAYDLAVAMCDLLAAIPSLDVGDENKAVGELRLAYRPAHEALLVRPDRQADNIRGNVEV